MTFRRILFLLSFLALTPIILTLTSSQPETFRLIAPLTIISFLIMLGLAGGSSVSHSRSFKLIFVSILLFMLILPIAVFATPLGFILVFFYQALEGDYIGPVFAILIPISILLSFLGLWFEKPSDLWRGIKSLLTWVRRKFSS